MFRLWYINPVAVSVRALVVEVYFKYDGGADDGSRVLPAGIPGDPPQSKGVQMPIYVPPPAEPYGSFTDYTAIQAAAATAADDITSVRPNTPSDGSPGAISLIYFDDLNQRHSCKMRLTTVANPYDYSQMLGEANRLAPGLASVLPSTQHVDGFDVYNDLGVQIFAGLLTASHPGAHVNAGSLNSNSYSVSITGRGLAPGPGFFPGNTLTRFFPITGYNQDRGRKFLRMSDDLGLVRWAGALGTSTLCWADAHGWKAGIRPTCPIQFNAAVQRKYGV